MAFPRCPLAVGQSKGRWGPSRFSSCLPLSLSLLFYLSLSLFLAPSQDRFAQGHIHYAVEHLDPHLLSRWPEPNFCKWLDEEGRFALASLLGGETTLRLLSALCETGASWPRGQQQQAGCCDDSHAADAVDFEMRRRLIRPAPWRRLASSSLSESAYIRASENRYYGHKPSPATIPSAFPPSISLAAVLASSPQSEPGNAPYESADTEKKGRREKRSKALPETEKGESGSFASFRSFASALVSAFFVTIATELGDRTFFLAALLSMKYSKLIVFSATCVALFLMTAVSTGVGRLLHWAPDTFALKAHLGEFPIDAWISTLLLFFFAAWHLKSLWETEDASPPSRASSFSVPGHAAQSARELRATGGSPRGPGKSRQGDAESDTAQPPRKPREQDVGTSARRGERREELVEGARHQTRDPREGNGKETGGSARRSSEISTRPGCSPQDALSLSLHMEESEGWPSSETGSERSLSRASSRSVDGRDDSEGKGPLKGCSEVHSANRADGVDENFMEAEEELQRIQYTRLGVRPSSLKVLWEVFLVIGAAEIGDKSMVATVGLATSQNPFGVFVGSCLGHAGVTLLAVVAGMMLQGRLSERYMNICCGLLFLGFGIFALFDAIARPES
ncbi:putative transmembrane protein [Neospora caninum Liverpool]|uniref:Putative transmembrane protein n=1 Tax=Neospora caninum (strain Liverpool) TaxID=572307 RepID=F0VR77_NEOCL|nr:putative transmembrane protein [Neospora caninum Liverpool]CBZ56225.1 putative transmembrane protein [Neospora caninum Liverpool]CEL70987.1 TPA: transmembrane protein, putative [Neospora caninum Liverpool]|eukprot:XP_003886250.1 putative transmembrane protein [Neospora caninum Liverpool]